MLDYNPAIIPFPAYYLDDATLIEHYNALTFFADGHEDYCDEPCARAQATCDAIVKELGKRNATFSIVDGKITQTP